MSGSRTMMLIGAALVLLAACGDDVGGATYHAGLGSSAGTLGTTAASPASGSEPVPVPVEAVGSDATSSTTAPTTTSAAASTVDGTDPTAVTEGTSAEPTDDGLNPLGGDSPEDRLMPSVLCMNLQEAQDEIQDHGVFFSRSEDATGEGRMQIRDSNWQVVGQQPEPGEPIGEGDAVLFVVKYDDDVPNPC